jgi:hypothetical protein
MAVLRAPWWRRTGIPAFFWASGLLGATLVTGAGHRDLALRVAFLPILLGLLFGIELWRRRAIIRRDEVEVRGLFRAARIRFDELEAFTYDARSYRLYLPIPIGRIARLALVARGRRVVFHAGFAHFDQYVPLLVNLAVEAAVKRMREQIDRGERAHFGRRLSVDRKGVYLSALTGRETEVTLDQLRLDVADGSVFISDGTRRVATLSLRRTPNLLALPQLVDELSANRDSPRPEALYEALALGA